MTGRDGAGRSCWASAGFAAASLLCGIAQAPGPLVAARALQGVGRALLVCAALFALGGALSWLTLRADVLEPDRG
ncbi:hypothetical protein ACI797_19300 [Geodermatophilus sp. SYSU D00691]